MFNHKNMFNHSIFGHSIFNHSIFDQGINIKMPSSHSHTCKTYIMTCTTCAERFASTKCTNPAPHHTHATPKELSTLPGSQLCATLQGFSEFCWHCDPEARLDFTSTAGHSRTNSSASRSSAIKTKYAHKGRVIRRKTSKGLLQVKAVVVRKTSSATPAMATSFAEKTAVTKELVGRVLRRCADGLSGCFTARRRRNAERIPSPEELFRGFARSPRPYSMETIDDWKLPRMFYD